MKTHETKKRSQKKYLPLFGLAVIFVLSLLVYVLLNIYRGQDEYHIVKFNGDGDLMNLSRFYYTAYAENDGAKPGAILARKDDLLFFNSFIKFYNIPGKDSFNFRDENDSIFYVDNQINSINISAEYNQLPAFEKTKAADFSGLESLMFSNEIPDEYIPYLREIAAKKPQLNLFFNTDDSVNSLLTYTKKADFFSPGNVTVALTQGQFPLLAKWNKAECLYLSIDDTLVTDAIPAMPALNQLILVENDENIISPSLLKNNPQIKRITLFNDHNNLSILQPLNNLEELCVMNNDSLDIINILKYRDRLTSLVLSGTWSHIDSLSSFRKLRWLGLPENSTQEQFNNIVSTLPDIEILELQGNDLITDYGPLLPLSNLRGLVITDSVPDRKTLLHMSQLRYLSVEEKHDDSTLIKDLSKALPGCVVVPNSGACVGSGWLLLIVPLSLLFAFIISYHSREKIHER